MAIVRILSLVVLGVLALSCGDSSGDSSCNSFCNVAAQCGGEDRAECVSTCVSNAAEAETISEACLAAFLGRTGCVGGLTCQQAEAWLDEVPPDSYPCRDEDIAVDQDCFSTVQ
ncbi:MAG: hypothetical protein AAF436_16945 [Myxococcota bacterium]